MNRNFRKNPALEEFKARFKKKLSIIESISANNDIRIKTIVRIIKKSIASLEKRYYRTNERFEKVALEHDMDPDQLLKTIDFFFKEEISRLESLWNIEIEMGLGRFSKLN